MTTVGWAILGAAVGVGGLWTVIVAFEFRRLGRMRREASERLREAEKARK